MSQPEKNTRLSDEVRSILAIARNEAARACFAKVQTDHLLMGLLIEKCIARDILYTTHVTTVLANKLLAHAPETMKLELQEVTYSPSLIQVFDRAEAHRRQWNHAQVQGVHLLAALLERLEGDHAMRIFRILCTDLDELRRKTEIHLKLLTPFGTVHKSPTSNTTSAAPSVVTAPEEPQGAIAKKTSFSLQDWMTEETTRLLANAKEHASKLDSPSVRIEDLLAAILASPDDPACKILACFVDFYRVSQLTEIAYEGKKDVEDADAFDYNALQVLNRANQQCRRLGNKLIRPGDILWGIMELSEEEQTLPQLGADLGDDITRFREALIRSNTQPVNEQEGDSNANSLMPTATTVNVTARAFNALNNAKGEAKLLGHADILNIHLVLGLIAVAQQTEVAFVVNRKLDLEVIRLGLAEQTAKKCAFLQADQQPVFSRELKTVLEAAIAEARRVNAQLLDINHLAIGVLRKHPEEIKWLLAAHDMEARSLEKQLINCWFHQVHKGGAVAEAGGEIDVEFINDYFEGAQIATSTAGEPKHPSYMSKLTVRTKRLLKCAESYADEFGHQRVCLEEIVLAILTESSSIASLSLEDVGTDLETAKDSFSRSATRGRGRKGSNMLALSFKTLSVFKAATEQAKSMGKELVDPEHLLLAIALQQEGISDLTLETLGINGKELRKAVIKRMAAE